MQWLRVSNCLEKFVVIKHSKKQKLLYFLLSYVAHSLSLHTNNFSTQLCKDNILILKLFYIDALMNAAFIYIIVQLFLSLFMEQSDVEYPCHNNTQDRINIVYE